MKRVFAFMGFTCAVTLLIANLLPLKAVIIISSVLFAALIISVSIKNLRRARVVPIVIACALLSCLLFTFKMYCEVIPQLELDGKTVSAVFRITNIPQKTSGGYIYEAKTVSLDGDGKSVPQNIKIKINTKNLIEADYCDLISADIKLQVTGENAYDSFGCFSDGIYLRTGLYSYNVRKTENNSLNYYILKLRENIKSIFTEELSGDCAGLTLALITGDTSVLSDELLGNLKICGASHITAVSGLHLSILTGFIYFLLKKINSNKYVSFAVMLFSVIFYIFAANFSKSVIRAGIMTVILLCGKLINNKADALNSLGAAAFILCLNPFSVTDPSAVLTVCAVLGITTIYKNLTNKIKVKNIVFNKLINSVLLTASITVSTLPAVYLYYHSVSLISIIANIVLIPAAEILIILSMMFLVLHKVPVLSLCIIALCNTFTGIITVCAKLFAKYLSFLSLSLDKTVFGVAIALIILFAGICLLFFREIRIKALGIFTAFVIAISSLFAVYQDNYSYTLYILPNGSAALYGNGNLVIIGADESSDAYNIKSALPAVKFKSETAIDCEYDILDESIFDGTEKETIESDFNSTKLYDGVTAQKDGDTVTLSVYNNTVIIENDYVCTSAGKYMRDIYGKFGENINYSEIYYSYGEDE